MSADPDQPELFPEFNAAGALRAAFESRRRASGKDASTSTSESAGHPPRALGYEMQGEIARGGMGVIHKAFDRELDRDVALKVLRDELSGETRLVRRFLEEARVTARLDHPGIVPVYEVGRDPQGRPFFAMRLVRGRELRRIIELAHKNAEGWNQTRALSVIQKVCEAMAYAHGRGVIHRDLKPSNVMVGEFGEVYVMDWGLARKIGSEDTHDMRLRPASTSTRSSEAKAGDVVMSARGMSTDIESPIVTMDGDVLGTPCYMSPEQARGELAELGPRSDVYSLGAMLYHLLAGEMPYVPSGASVASRQVLLHLVQGPPRPLSEVQKDVPSELVAISEKAMSREPKDRYDDMLSMAEDVRAFLEQRVVSAYETGAWAEAKKWVQRNKRLSAAMVLAVAALIAGLLVSLSLKAKSDANYVRAENNAQRAEESAHVANDERDKALKIASFLEETLGGVAPSVALGRDTTMLREMMDAAWKRVEKGDLAAAPQAEVRLSLVIGSALHEIAQYEQSELSLRRALDTVRRLPAGDEVLSARVLSTLGVVLRDRGSLDEAERVLREALEMRRRLFPDGHYELAVSLENLAALHLSKGDTGAAESLFREALAMNRRLHSQDDDAVAINLTNLAVVLQARADLPGAEKCLRESIEIQERLHPGDHPALAASLCNLATVLSDQHDLVGAESFQRRALEMRRRLLPHDHADVATSLNNLATVLQMRGDVDAAEPFFREALEMQRRLFSGDHPLVASSLVNLAAVLQSREDWTGAEEAYEQGLSMMRRIFKGDHADIARCLYSEASMLQRRGDMDRAERLLREGLEMEKRIRPSVHPEIAVFQNSLGYLLMMHGDVTGSRAQFRDALVLRKQLYAGPHPDVTLSLFNLGIVCDQGGDIVASEGFLREALAMSLSISRDSDPSITSTEIELGHVISKQNRFCEAEEVFLDVAARIARGAALSPVWHKAYLERTIENYVVWEESEPGHGYGKRAEAWKTKLEELEK